MLTNKLTPLMCVIGLALAGGVVAFQGAPAHDHGGMMDHDMMEKMDTNHDGMVSAKEHADFANAMFARMDTNHDGMLSKDEMKAAHEKHEEMREKRDDKHEAMKEKSEDAKEANEQGKQR